MEKYRRKFIEKTKKVWQPYSSEQLSDEDAEEIIDNFVEFIELLIELDKEYGDSDSS